MLYVKFCHVKSHTDTISHYSWNKCHVINKFPLSPSLLERCFSKLSHSPHSQITWCYVHIFASICFVPSTLLLLFRGRVYQSICSKVRSLSGGSVYSSKYSTLLTCDQVALFPYFFGSCPPTFLSQISTLISHSGTLTFLAVIPE